MNSSFQKSNNSAAPDRVRGTPDHRRGVGLVDEHQTADRRVELPKFLQIFVSADDEFDLVKSCFFSAALSGLDGARLPVDPDDRSRGPNRFGDQHRDVADARAEVKHAHSGRNAAFADQPPRQTLEALSLKLKAFNFLVGVAEKVFGFRGHVRPFACGCLSPSNAARAPSTLRGPPFPPLRRRAWPAQRRLIQAINK